MVEQIFDEDGKKFLRALFVNERQNFIGPPAAVPDARPFVNITNALRNAVRNNLVAGIVNILAFQGITVPAGTSLYNAIVDFAHRTTEELEKEAKVIRMTGLSEDDKRDHEEKRAYQIGDTAAPPAGYTGPNAPQWMRKGYKPFKLISEKTGHRVRTVFFSLILLVVGITISTLIGSMWFMVGFIFWAFFTILPDPEENKMVEDSENYFAGSLFANRENRTNTGIAFLKAISKVGIIVSFIGGLYVTPFPMSNLLLLFLAFGFYFSMPVEFEPRKPYDFILSFFRVLLGVFIAVFIFGAFGAGIFQSRELGWLTLAFFVVFPVATEKESIARALGRMGSGTGESYEMLDKIIFLVIMLAFLAGGFGLMGSGLDIFTGGGGLFTGGTGGIVFSAVWILGLIAGLTTPAETRPWMGIIILMVGFVVFGMGAGQQAMGVAFFGEWWPTVHNTVTEFMEPIGEMFGQFQNTFGQTWLLFTNPVSFAQQISQGNFAQNELGVTGAYGLEINRFDVQSIYIDEPFVIEIDLENKGIYHAKNVRIEILTNIKDFRIGRTEADLSLSAPKMIPLPEPDKYDRTWYVYTLDSIALPALQDIERQDALPILLMGKMYCDDFRDSAWKDFGIVGGKEHTVREMFIPFVINITYEYEAESNLQLDFISTEEWRRLSSEDKLNRGRKLSTVSTSPASLNLGSMDQPIKEDSPFYVGFNLSTSWPKNTLVSNSTVYFTLPKEMGTPTMCTKSPSHITPDPEIWNYTFNMNGPQKSVFCSYDFDPTRSIQVPKKTFTVSASAVYVFSKWKERDTQFNFNDVCWPQEGAVNITSP